MKKILIILTTSILTSCGITHYETVMQHKQVTGFYRDGLPKFKDVDTAKVLHMKVGDVYYLLKKRPLWRKKSLH